MNTSLSLSTESTPSLSTAAGYLLLISLPSPLIFNPPSTLPLSILFDAQTTIQGTQFHCQKQVLFPALSPMEGSVLKH